jgi:hypothetical protein
MLKRDITEMKITNWKNCIKNRSKWKEFVGDEEEEEEEEQQQQQQFTLVCTT